MRNTLKARSAATLALALVAFVAGGMRAGADVQNGNLPGGTSIQVAINTPADGELVASPPGNVSVTGTAAVGEGLPVENTALIYMLDLSESTEFANPGCGGDANGDGTANTVLDCEVAAAKQLNQSAISNGTVGEVAAGGFADSADSADVGPAAGIQTYTAPDTDAGGAAGPDVEQAVASADLNVSGGDNGFTQFSLRTVGAGNTSFEAGVQTSCGLSNGSSEPNRIVIFMSDGLATAGGNAIDDLPCSPNPATFHTFAIGANSDCATNQGGRGSLQQIADATGGTCTEVNDASQLPNVVPGVIESELTSLEMTVDGGAPQDISATANPPLPQQGPANVTYGPVQVNGLAPGIHEICVTAHGSDGGGEGSVTDCHEFTVADINLAPEQETNELGTPGQTHTVTATVAAGSDGGVANVPVDFKVTSGPNQGASGGDTTDVNGEATFTYIAQQGPSGLGTDTIEACFTDDQGVVACDTAEKHWADTTPPDVACTETVNPSGNNIPKAGNGPPGGGGQNPDGYYVLSASDSVDPNPQIFVRDTGSGTIFGPFASGTNIKYTQAPGAPPSQKPIGGPTSAVAWHITGTGDAAVFAVDSSGNVSPDSFCRVPPPPK